MSDKPHPESKPLWRRPTLAAAALSEDEALILQALRQGLKCAETRVAQFERAQHDYEQAQFSALFALGHAAEEAMAAMAQEVRNWRAHGKPRAWAQVGPFYYHLALLQQGLA